ncbi:MAG: carboxylating nicotinate-nucleotide diphosphorylase [Lentimicrobiaceae bacterium]|jgi:nicotinate-nucleotide pyrophosphorylase (carboxylating)|nr:carboxylating nicotinate-nucleotide diphosphorylase [Lentimicrobiaceae bacterium]
MKTSITAIEQLINQAIKEDIGNGDHTSLSTIPTGTQGKMYLLIKESGVLAGIEIAEKVFTQIDPDIQFKRFITDGTFVNSGDIAFEISGLVVSMLSAERLALNFMQRMSGIATKTAYLVSLLNGLPTRLLDTRKTTPNMRIFEKQAVRLGGGENHRFGLFDMILIKNNHVDFAGGVRNALIAANNYLKQKKLNIPIEIEVRNFNELDEALDTGNFQRIMLDNFSTSDLKKAVEIIAGRYETEASGGITEKTLYDYALTGVTFISVGALTHHIKSLDMSLRAVVE